MARKKKVNLFLAVPFQSTLKQMATVQSSSNTILILDIEGYIGISRLPKLLYDGGFRVIAISKKDNALTKTKYVESLNFVPEDVAKGSLQFWQFILGIIRGWKPIIIIPGDSTAVSLLHSFCKFEKNLLPRQEDEWILKMLRFSFGTTEPSLLDASFLKWELYLVANELEIPTPNQQLVHLDSQAAANFAKRFNFQVFFKWSESAGGNHSVVSTQDQLTQYLNQPTVVVKLFHEGKNLIIQERLPPGRRSYCFLARNGKILGGFGIKVLQV